ncbi:MAG: ankyrin repeat domain-containing protein [Brevinema sp.]
MAYEDKRFDVLELVFRYWADNNSVFNEYFLLLMNYQKGETLEKNQSLKTPQEVKASVKPNINEKKTTCVAVSFNDLKKVIQNKKWDAIKEILQVQTFKPEEIQILVEEIQQKKDYTILKTFLRSNQCIFLYDSLLPFLALNKKHDLAQIIVTTWDHALLSQHCIRVFNSTDWDLIHIYLTLNLQEFIPKSSLIEEALHQKKWDILKIVKKLPLSFPNLEAYLQQYLDENDWDSIKHLLEIGLNINLTVKNGDSLLETCFIYDQDVLVQLLIEQDCIIEEHKILHNGETLFTLAVKKNNLDFVDYLSQTHIIQPECYDKMHLIEFSLDNNHNEMIVKLLELGIGSEEILSNGQTIFTHYIYENNIEILHKILRHSLDLNQKNIVSESPLYLAVTNKMISIIPILLKNGADPFEILPSGKTILDLVNEADDPAIIQEFKKSKVPIPIDETLLIENIEAKEWENLKKMAKNTYDLQKFNLILEELLFPNLVFSKKIRITDFLDSGFSHIYDILLKIDQKKEPSRGDGIEKFYQRPNSDLWVYRYSYHGRIIIQRKKNEPDFVYMIDPSHAYIKYLKKDKSSL